MPEDRYITIVLVVIIFILCVFIGFLIASPQKSAGITNGTGFSNSPESSIAPDITGGTSHSDQQRNISWTPTTDIVITESHFKQDEPGVRVLAGFVKNTGNKTITSFQMFFNLSDSTETEYHNIGYIVGNIQFLPNQTRDFEAIFQNHDNMTKIQNATITVLG
jgi:hypothetical protein